VTAAQVVEAVFPAMKASEREAVAARTRIEMDAARACMCAATACRQRGDPLRPCLPTGAGRPIVGIVEDDGVTVHTLDCPRCRMGRPEELWRDLQWTSQAEKQTTSVAALGPPSATRPACWGGVHHHRRNGSNILNLRMHHRQSDFFDVDWDVEVADART
jgi:GTP pyrophosphokinase/guanosine-3',5'-bis(diphosphate) 3'-pyrophosphohydrolase